MASSGSTARSKARRSGIKKDQAPAANAAKSSESNTSKKNTSLHETTGIVGLYDRTVKFLGSVKDEWGRVSWPSLPELRTATIVVLVTLILVSAYMGVVNKILTALFGTADVPV
ncbi:MAG: preprotein translocase subunit SecE [Candidatus Bruticola sp.]